MADDDVENPWGLIYPVANEVVASPSLRPPPLNYSAGTGVGRVQIVYLQMFGCVNIHGIHG